MHRQAALKRQDLSCTDLAHRELESVLFSIITIMLLLCLLTLQLLYHLYHHNHCVWPAEDLLL